MTTQNVGFWELFTVVGVICKLIQQWGHQRSKGQKCLTLPIFVKYLKYKILSKVIAVEDRPTYFIAL